MTTKKKFDFKKEQPELYKPSSKQVSLVEVPSMKFFMINGKGNPNTAQEYKDAIEFWKTRNPKSLKTKQND